MGFPPEGTLRSECVDRTHTHPVIVNAPDEDFATRYKVQSWTPGTAFGCVAGFEEGRKRDRAVKTLPVELDPKATWDIVKQLCLM